VTIRRLKRSDIPAIREIDRMAFDADEQYDAEFYTGILAIDTFTALVAEGNAVVFGWALFDTSVNPTRLRSLSVHPRHRRRGYGKALLRYATARFDDIDLLVRPGNGAAIALYESCGFSIGAPDRQMPDRLRMTRRHHFSG
jgi:ribosomal protein S18 acetylase RimI-like enzyme